MKLNTRILLTGFMLAWYTVLEQVMRVNYLGSLYSALAVVPLMKQQQSGGGGRLVFVSSLAGLAGEW